MAGYLGATPVPQATQHRESFTATSGQTTFATAGYTAGFVDVYLNGSHLSPADFTATNGSDVVLASGASADDVCDIISHSAFEVNAQTFTGTTTMTDVVAASLDISGNIDIDGTTNLDIVDIDGAVDVAGAATFNDDIIGNKTLRLYTTDDQANQWYIYTHTDDTLRYNYNGAGADEVVINTTGAVTKPKQPSFHVNNAAGLTDNITIGSFKTISMGTEVYDTTDNFANDVFTAPVTGKYQMNVQLLISTMDSASTYIVFDCTTSNRNYHYIIYPTISITADGSQQIVWSFVADMDAGDTSYLRAIQSGGTAQADVQSDANYTRWTGYLLG